MSKKKNEKAAEQEEQPQSPNEQLAVQESENTSVMAKLDEPVLYWKKIKINNDTLYVEFQHRLPGGIIKNVNQESNSLVHNDLRNAMQKLAKHVAIMADTSESVNIKYLIDLGNDFSDISEGLDDIKVTGVVLTGDERPEGVMIIAQKKIGPKVLNLLTPNMKFEEAAFYRWMEDLEVDLQGIEYEAHEYVFGNKYAIKQLEMEFEEGDNDDNITEVEFEEKE